MICEFYIGIDVIFHPLFWFEDQFLKIEWKPILIFRNVKMNNQFKSFKKHLF